MADVRDAMQKLAACAPITTFVDENGNVMASSGNRYQDYAYPHVSEPAPNEIVGELQGIRRVFEEGLYLDRHLHVLLGEILMKQNEIVNRLTADTRIAELKAAKWEEYARKIEAELDHLKVRGHE